MSKWRKKQKHARRGWAEQTMDHPVARRFEDHCVRMIAEANSLGLTSLDEVREYIRDHPDTAKMVGECMQHPDFDWVIIAVKNECDARARPN
jgi:hypothetical protein